MPQTEGAVPAALDQPRSSVAAPALPANSCALPAGGVTKAKAINADQDPVPDFGADSYPEPVDAPEASATMAAGHLPTLTRASRQHQDDIAVQTGQKKADLGAASPAATSIFTPDGTGTVANPEANLSEGVVVNARRNDVDSRSSPPTLFTNSESAPVSQHQPASQIGPALAALQTGKDGSSRVNILLDPAELGSVQVSIHRSHAGAVEVNVAVERLETLRSLQADIGHLHQALDRAGLADHRSVVLQLVPVDAWSSIGQQNTNGQQSLAGGFQQGARQDRPSSFVGLSGSEPASASDDSLTPSKRSTHSYWRPAGIDITA